MSGSLLLAMFHNRTSLDQVLDSLQQIGMPGKRLHLFAKEKHHRPLQRLIGHGQEDMLNHELNKLDLTAEDILTYQRGYATGSFLLIIDNGPLQQDALHILQTHRAMVSTPNQRASTGAITPGMRPDDSSQDGIATTADGISALTIDDATMETDLQHLQRIQDQKTTTLEI